MNDERVIKNIKKTRYYLTHQPTIYLAHTLSTRDYVTKNLIPKFKDAGFNIVNPFRDRLEELKKYGDDEQKIRLELKMLPRWIVTHDIADVDICDGIVVYNPKGASYGTAYETAYAWLVKHIPIFYIVKEEYLYHPWINYIGSGVVEEKDIDILIGIMKKMYKPPL